MTRPLLQIEDLRVAFRVRDAMIPAVNGIGFMLQRSETLAIVGESGSGKSVTCHSILGLLRAPEAEIQRGRILLDGIDLLRLDPRQLRAIRGRRIGMVFQDPGSALNPYLTVGTQLTEVLCRHRRLRRRAAGSQAAELLREVGIDDAARTVRCYPHELSGGMRQRAMIAIALAGDPDLLIADEPTTALDVLRQAQVLDLLRAIQRRRRLSVLLVTHDLAVAAAFAHRLLIMRAGSVVEEGMTAEVLRAPRAPYTRALIAAAARPARAAGPSPGGATLLTVIDVSVHYRLASGAFGRAQVLPAVEHVSLTIARGEVLGLVGESGCGKTTLGRAIMRLVPVASGRITLAGMALTELSARELVLARAEFQMIFQDPYASLNPRLTVFSTLAEPLRLRGVSADALVGEVASLLADVGLQASDMLKFPHAFSGGQRQRIAIARALGRRPKLIIADEPVSSLDVTIQSQVLKLLLELVRRFDLTMLFISHDLTIVRYLCDRVAVMYQGRIVEQGAVASIFAAPQHPYTRSLLAATPALPAAAATMGCN